MNPNDQDITLRSLAAIRRAGAFPDVRVTTIQGWVHLSGSVGRGADRWRIEAAVGTLPGLAGVSAQISVRA